MDQGDLILFYQQLLTQNWSPSTTLYDIKRDFDLFHRAIRLLKKERYRAINMLPGYARELVDFPHDEIEERLIALRLAYYELVKDAKTVPPEPIPLPEPPDYEDDNRVFRKKYRTTLLAMIFPYWFYLAIVVFIVGLASLFVSSIIIALTSLEYWETPTFSDVLDYLAGCAHVCLATIVAGVAAYPLCLIFIPMHSAFQSSGEVKKHNQFLYLLYQDEFNKWRDVNEELKERLATLEVKERVYAEEGSFNN